MASDKRVNQRLVRRIQGMLKDVPVEVIGHIESTFACCGNGTVALVKIDEGKPAPKSQRTTKPLKK